MLKVCSTLLVIVLLAACRPISTSEVVSQTCPSWTGDGYQAAVCDVQLESSTLGYTREISITDWEMIRITVSGGQFYIDNGRNIRIFAENGDGQSLFGLLQPGSYILTKGNAVTGLRQAIAGFRIVNYAGSGHGIDLSIEYIRRTPS